MAFDHGQRSIELIGLLAEKLTEASPDRCCGETHLHKAAFIAEEALGAPIGLEWTLYKFGPYSHEMRPALEACEREGMLRVEPQAKGARITRPDGAPELRAEASLQPGLEALAAMLAPMDVEELEAIGTAAWVTRINHDQPRTVRSRTDRMVAMKPHMSAATATRAVEEFDSFLRGIDTHSPVPDRERMAKLASITEELHPRTGSLDIYRPRIRIRIEVDPR